MNYNFDLHFDCKTEEEVKAKLKEFKIAKDNYYFLLSMCENFGLKNIIEEFKEKEI